MHCPPANRRDAGFTLIEILTAMAIVAILAAILLATFLKARAQAQLGASKANIKSVAIALETYFTDTNSYPIIVAALVPAYVRGLPEDPCTEGAYAYDVSMGGSPPADYKLSVAFPLTNTCRIIAPGISYTPAGGLRETP